jgi:predicted ferric reductase
MDMKNLIVAVFIIVIVLAIISMLPTGATGNLITLSASVQLSLLIIAFALFSISVMLSKKKYYPS